MNHRDAYLGAIRYALAKHEDQREKLIKASLVAAANGVPLHEVAAAAGVHRTTLYRWIKRDDPEENEA